MKYLLTLSEAAQTELLEIARWYEDRNPRAARNFEAQVRTAFALLQENPSIHAIVGGGIRKTSLRVFSYHIFYEIRHAEILVVAVLHHSRYPRYGY